MSKAHLSLHFFQKPDPPPFPYRPQLMCPPKRCFVAACLHKLFEIIFLVRLIGAEWNESSPQGKGLLMTFSSLFIYYFYYYFFFADSMSAMRKLIRMSFTLYLFKTTHMCTILQAAVCGVCLGAVDQGKRQVVEYSLINNHLLMP